MVRIFVKGGVWKNSEDEVLKAAVMKYGINNWSRVASLLVRKSAKQCKARWYEWLDPSVKKTEWTREEEEKLLHLAKLFPTQWRTIAPIVGRTAHQCLEHYEKLLDQAQGNDEDDSGTGKSFVPASARSANRGGGGLVSGLSSSPGSAEGAAAAVVRGRFDDPRRLRPGEIDPHPETKPSRADAIDMQDDEKEMLQEARARLANTRGKKAKRKAREKQLEEARRLAALQKRRELKAAGLITSLRPRKRRREMDYGVDIPFEEKPPPGFHAVGAEENPEANLNFANISLQQLEGTMRAQEEMKLRKEDARKLKRLQEENLPLYLQQLEERRKLDMLRQKQKLNLPEPALQEHELEEIIRLGAEAAAMNAAAGSGGPTNKLLAGSSTSAPAGATPLTVGGVSLATVRTPRREDTILMEAANAVMTINQTTPLEGGENYLLHETSLKAAAGGKFSAAQRTPNLLKHRAGTSASGLSSLEATPVSTADNGSFTPGPGTTQGSGASAAESGGMGEKARLSLARLQVCSSLATLPAPQNEIEPALPTAEELAALDESLLQQAETEEDMEDIFRRRQQAAEAARHAEWLRQSQAVQQHLPRPYVLPAERTTPLPCFYADEQHLQQQLLQLVQQEGEQPTEAQVAEVARGMKEAEKMVNQEMMALLAYDAFKHPFKGCQPSSPVPDLLKLDDAFLHEAREMLKCEGQLLQHQSEVGEDTSADNKIVAKAFENAQDAYIYLPSAKSFQLYHSLSREERSEALRSQFEDLRKQVDATSHRSKKAQKKYLVLTKGYENRAKDLVEKIEEAYREYELQAANLSAFQSLHEQEKQAIARRSEEQQKLLVQERGKHLWMQRRYAELQRQKEQLQSYLAVKSVAGENRVPNSVVA